MLRTVLVSMALGCVGVFGAAADDDKDHGTLCATQEEASRIAGFYGDTPGLLPFSASGRLGLSEAKVLHALTGGKTQGTSGMAFADVWNAMAGLKHVTVLIIVEGSLFEVKSDLSPGEKSSRSHFFNLGTSEALRGHLNPNGISAIYSLHIPGEEQNMYAILFLNHAGDQVFGLYLSGEGRVASEEEIARFEHVSELIASRGPVCANGN